MIQFILFIVQTFSIIQHHTIPHTDHSLLHLNPANIDQHLHHHESLLVVFYRQKSNHSNHFLREVKHSLTILRESEIILAQFDATHQKEWLKQFNITKLPHILFFKKDEIFHYKSLNLTTRKLITWVHKLIHPKINIATSDQELKNFMRSSINGTFLIAKGENDPLIKEFKYLTNRYPLNIFAIIQDQNITTHYQSQIINFFNQGKSFLEFVGPYKHINIQYFIENLILQRPVKEPYWVYKLASRFERNIIVLFERDNDNTSLPIFIQASQIVGYEVPLLFVNESYISNSFIKFFELAGSPQSFKSGISIIAKNGRHKHVYQYDTIRVDYIQEFIDHFFNEKLHHFQKKNEPHEDHQRYLLPLKIHHGDEFEQRLKDKNKITIAIYYSSHDTDQNLIINNFSTLAKELLDLKKVQVIGVDLHWNDMDNLHKFDTPFYRIVYYGDVGNSSEIKIKQQFAKIDKIELQVRRRVQLERNENEMRQDL